MRGLGHILSASQSFFYIVIDLIISSSSSETSTGGIPGHVAWLPGNPSWNTYNGELRSNDTIFHDAWQDYVGSPLPFETAESNHLNQSGRA